MVWQFGHWTRMTMLSCTLFSFHPRPGIDRFSNCRLYALLPYFYKIIIIDIKYFVYNLREIGYVYLIGYGKIKCDNGILEILVYWSV